ncbi:carotenoid ester lipase [Moniliophthora roreri MCA 2997]|uniref:Carotenoid ester lipase n=1 Tax=Moniliophthora roreri (strain MCA 2997) TaxID=1381753 RepID=V2WRE3_MONRO|nr:carotenoid ester lipase [Moniliophthora roreri MCA 2997]
MKLTLSSLASLLLLCLAQRTLIPITLDYGTFIGINGQRSKVISWRGIPYADPPVKHLRWRAAVSPPTRHLGNVDATNWGDACIVTTTTWVVPGQSENGLFANDVMVRFHGGGYQGGNTREAIPDADVVDRSCSYLLRIGSHSGFITAGSPLQRDGQLNIGFQDQREALRGVQRYISVFGGDRDRVTIWVQSVGAGSTLLHVGAYQSSLQHKY